MAHRRHPHKGSHAHRVFRGRRRSTHHVIHHHPHKGSHVKRPGAHHPHKPGHRKPRRVVRHVTRHPVGHHRGVHHAKALAYLKLRKSKRDKARLRPTKHRLVKYLRRPRKGKVSKG